MKSVKLSPILAYPYLKDVSKYPWENLRFFWGWYFFKKYGVPRGVDLAPGIKHRAYQNIILCQSTDIYFFSSTLLYQGPHNIYESYRTGVSVKWLSQRYKKRYVREKPLVPLKVEGKGIVHSHIHTIVSIQSIKCLVSLFSDYFINIISFLSTSLTYQK